MVVWDHELILSQTTGKSKRGQATFLKNILEPLLICYKYRRAPLVGEKTKVT